MVNHSHKYEDGKVLEHMIAHVCHEGVGKKGANNVALLIVKMLQWPNLLFQEDSAGGELNIICVQACGVAQVNGVFFSVNFFFLIIIH